jgi:vacuolar-type H+-ATPase subunit I/STV1
MRDYVDDVQVGRHAKSVYIVVFWDGRNIRDKIQKICDSFSGNRYELPEFSSIPNKIQEIENSI